MVELDYCYDKAVMATMFDIFDDSNNPTGRTATFDEVRGQGLWHRGAHIVMYTADKRVLLQKRSRSLDFHPGEIEISVGGGVDAGEKPIEAAVREIAEETGIIVAPSRLHPLQIRKYNHRYKYRGKTKFIRAFLYVYKLEVTEAECKKMRPAPGEVDGLFWLSRLRVRWAIRRHYVRGFGRLSPRYAMWKLMLRSIDD